MWHGWLCWWTALGLAFTGLYSFGDRVAAQDGSPKPLPADLVAAWKKDLKDSYDCWTFQNTLGQIARDDRLATPKAGYIPAFRIVTDDVREGTLARLPAPEAPFGIFCESGLSRRKETTFPVSLLKQLAGMKNLRVLSLEERKVTEAGLKELAVCKNLQMLNVNHCSEVTDAALQDLARIEGLKTLLVKRCVKVTDRGMKEIAKMKTLEVLTIEHTQVTDAGLRDLTGLKSLRLLYTNGTGITPDGLMLFEKSLPNCKINQ